MIPELSEPIQNKETNTKIELTMQEWFKVCLERPDAFAYTYFPHIVKSPSSPFHFLLYNLIRKINKTDYSNHIAIAAPRGNAKTQIMSVILPIWCTMFEQKKHIILISETGRQSENNLESIRHELTSNDKLAEHFPYAFGEGSKWRTDVITTKNGISIVALGSGKRIRGSQKLSARPDLLLCHPAGTKILMSEGNKDVSKLKIGDVVYNHKWELDKIINWKPYTWTGDYFKFNLYGHPEEIEATAGHKFFVRKSGPKEYIPTNKYMKCLDRNRFKRRKYKRLNTYLPLQKLNVREIKKGDMVGYAINNKVLSVEEIAEIEGWDTNSYEILKDKQFWKLLGIILGDGHILNKRNIIIISCNPKEIKHIKEITTALNIFNIKYKIKDTIDKATKQIYIYSNLLHRITIEWKKDKNSHKVPTRSIEFLDPELQKEIIKGYIAADGWRNPKQGVKITSVCLELLEFMQRIMLRIGIIGSIRNGIKGGKAIILGREVNAQDKYDLYFMSGAASILGYNEIPEPKRYNVKNWFIEDEWVWRKVKNIKSEYKTDTVYPFTVENEHSYNNTLYSAKQCDDIEGDEQVQTKNQRDKLEEWFTKAVLGLAGPNEKMDTIVTGTILHPHSLLSKLLNPKKFPGWEGHKFKAVIQPSHSPLWKDWERLYIDQENPDRREDAREFFRQHEKEMLEGVEVLWPEGEPYYSLMEYRINAGIKAFQCFDGDTNIVVKDRRYKKIKDIEIGNKVLTKDGSAQKVTYINSKYTNSDMYRIKIAGIADKIYTTEEHPFLIWPRTTYKNLVLSHQHLDRELVTYNTDKRKKEIVRRIESNELVWKYAKDLQIGDTTVQPIYQPSIKEHRCNSDWWWLVGYYLAEGCTNSYNKRTVCFSANINEIPYLKKAKRICKKFGYGKTHTIKKGGYFSDKVAQLYLTSKELADELVPYGHRAHNKILPSFIDDICLECFNSLWEGYIAGDGYTIKRGWKDYKTSYKGVNSASEKLLLGFQRNWLKFGCISYMYKMRDFGKGEICGREINHRPLWSLQKIEGKRVKQVWIHNKYLYSRIQTVEKVLDPKPYLVYGLTVENNHTYCVPGAIVKNSEKMNSPIDPSACVFNMEKVVYFNRSDVNLDDLTFYGSMDPASGDAKQKGDLSAIITVGKNPKTGITYVFDVMTTAEKGPTECIKYIKQQHERYNYKRFALDSDALKLYKEFITQEIPDLANRLVLYDLRLKKQKRIDRLEPVLHDGSVRLQQNQYELIDELTFYPKSEHDDALDALEIVMRLVGTRKYRILTY